MKHQATPEIKKMITIQIKNGVSPIDVAKNLGIPLQLVKYTQRKQALYFNRRLDKENRTDVQTIHDFVRLFHKELLPFVEANHQTKVKMERVFPGAVPLIIKLESLGFSQLAIARALGIDPGTIRMVIHGKHFSQRPQPKAEPPELPIVMIEPDPPGFWRRIWNKLFG